MKVLSEGVLGDSVVHTLELERDSIVKPEVEERRRRTNSFEGRSSGEVNDRDKLFVINVAFDLTVSSCPKAVPRAILLEHSTVNCKCSWATKTAEIINARGYENETKDWLV